jgi:hypothetical protein
MDAHCRKSVKGEGRKEEGKEGCRLGKEREGRRQKQKNGEGRRIEKRDRRQETGNVGACSINYKLVISINFNKDSHSLKIIKSIALLSMHF